MVGYRCGYRAFYRTFNRRRGRDRRHRNSLGPSDPSFRFVLNYSINMTNQQS